MPDIKPGDLALIISAVGSHALIGQCVQVHDLIDTRGDVAFRGRTFLNLSPEPAAFVELRDGSIWLWSVSRLMPLLGDAAECSWRKREVSA